jgi:hypothetical protein
METVIILGLILAVVFAVSYLVDRYGKTKTITPGAMKSIRSAAFLNAYLHDDSTQNEFVGKDVDESMEQGQDILWAEAGKFGKEFSLLVVDPSEEHLDQAFASAVRIVKCVHTMHVIQHTGPLPIEPIIEVVPDKTEGEDAT